MVGSLLRSGLCVPCSKEAKAGQRGQTCQCQRTGGARGTPRMLGTAHGDTGRGELVLLQQGCVELFHELSKDPRYWLVSAFCFC